MWGGNLGEEDDIVGGEAWEGGAARPPCGRRTRRRGEVPGRGRAEASTPDEGTRAVQGLVLAGRDARIVLPQPGQYEPCVWLPHQLEAQPRAGGLRHLLQPVASPWAGKACPHVSSWRGATVGESASRAIAKSVGPALSCRVFPSCPDDNLYRYLVGLSPRHIEAILSLPECPTYVSGTSLSWWIMTQVLWTRSFPNRMARKWRRMSSLGVKMTRGARVRRRGKVMKGVRGKLRGKKFLRS